MGASTPVSSWGYATGRRQDVSVKTGGYGLALSLFITRCRLWVGEWWQRSRPKGRCRGVLLISARRPSPASAVAAYCHRRCVRVCACVCRLVVASTPLPLSLEVCGFRKISTSPLSSSVRGFIIRSAAGCFNRLRSHHSSYPIWTELIWTNSKLFKEFNFHCAVIRSKHEIGSCITTVHDNACWKRIY